MNELGRLIQKFCPNGVMFMPLNVVCKVQNKGAITKDDLVDTGYPVINSSRDVLGYYWDFNNEPDTLVLTSHGAYAGFSHYLSERFYAGALCYPMKTSDETVIGTKYLYYVFKSLESTIREKYVNKSGVPYINFKALMNHKIAVPPIEVQSKIVKILDNFTERTVEITAELTAELTARKKQYEHYRDTLLKCNVDVQYRELKDVCISISDGDHMPPPKADKGVPFITISNITEYKQIDFSNVMYVPREYHDKVAEKRKPKCGDILYTVVGSFGIPVHITEHLEFVFQRHIAILRPNQEVIIPRYMYYAMQSWDFYKQADKAAKGAAQRTIGLGSLGRMTVFVPTLEEQKRIVEILDRFDTLCNDISTGIPTEIEARKKQYEYYRDKLLTFKEMSV